MRYDEIVSVLDYAGGHEQPVRILTTDQHEVVGVPTSVDTHVTAHEVFLRPGAPGDPFGRAGLRRGYVAV